MPPTFKRDRLTWLSYLFLAFYTFYLNALGPVTPFLKSELSLSYTISSLHFTAFAIGMILAGLFGHLVVQRIGRRRALWVAATGISLGAILLLLGRTPLLTIGGAVIMGTIGSLTVVIIPSLLSDWHGELRAVAIGEANVLASTSSAAAPLLVGLSVSLAGNWRLALGIMAFVPILMYLNFRQVPFPASDAVTGQSPARNTRLPLLYWIYWGAIFLGVAVEFCMISWSADYAENILGLSKANAAQAVSLFLGAMILGRFVMSRLVERIAPRRLVLASLAITTVGFLLFWRSSSLLALTGLFVTGLGVAGFYPLLISLALGAANNNTVQASARAALASGTAILTLPLILGSLADAVGIQPAYSVVIVLLLAMFMMVQAANSRRLTTQAVS
jgi:fucose permease